MLNPNIIKEEFERMKKDIEWTRDYSRGHFVIPKKDMDFFIDALEFVLNQQEKKKNSSKQKKRADK